MANKINLISGETYTLAELFSGHRRIIIPDLQRDYCWGDNADASDRSGLVPRFIDTLVEQFEKHPHGHRLNLGLIYGYETPADFVQLCDGQQRITTLFLLLGMLVKWTGDDVFRPLLISDYEFLEDDHEPYLQYAIRESSLYFLSDLVYRFFAGKGDEALDSVADIYDPDTGRSCSWFYSEYATDPSIMSMIRALRVIECDRERFERLDLHRFCEFLTERLTFIYYDMGNRANGEETFVVINTTGEPLSPTENLKPLVINAAINQRFAYTPFSANGRDGLSVASAWEEMENWFWRERDRRHFDTADRGFNEFLRWVTLVSGVSTEIKNSAINSPERFVFPHEEIPVDFIISAFDAFTALYAGHQTYLGRASLGQTDTLPGRGGTLKQIECFVMLPLLAYRRRRPTATDRELRRIYEFFHNLTNVANVAKSVNELIVPAIDIANTYDDLTDMISCSGGISRTILSLEEQSKLQIIKDNPADHMAVEDEFWRAQSLEVDTDAILMQGEIMPVIDWSGGVGAFSLQKFRQYVDILQRIFGRDRNDNGVNDPTRRALTAFDYPGYPLGGSSFGWGANWREIIGIAPDRFRQFLDLADSRGLDHIIAHRHNHSGYDIFARYPRLLAYTNWKNVLTFPGWGKTLCQNWRKRPVPVCLAVLMLRLGTAITGGIRDIARGWTLEYYTGNRDLTLRRGDTYTIRLTAAGDMMSAEVSGISDGFTYSYRLELDPAATDILVDRILNGPAVSPAPPCRHGHRCLKVKSVKKHRHGFCGTVKKL